MSGYFKITCLLALLSGCASLAPPHTPPDIALPAQYRYGNETAQVSLTRQTYFRDPQLQALLEQALQNNHDVRSALLRVQEAKALYRIERSARLPEVTLDGQAQRSRMPAGLSDSGQTDIAKEFQIGAGVSRWEIDLWGRIANLNQAALQEFLATEAGVRAVTLSLMAHVADTWFYLHELDTRLSLAREVQDRQRQSLHLFTRRLQAGTATRLEVTQVQTLLTQTDTLILQLQQQRDQQRNALALLLGRTEIPVIDYVRVETPLTLPPLSAGLPSDLLTQRPDILAAEHHLRAANAQIGAARAAFFPSIQLTALGGLASGELRDLFEGASRAWTLMPSVSLPIFNGGRNRANLTLAQVRKELAIVEYEHAIQSAFRDVADALDAQHWLQQQFEVQQHAVEIQAERRQLARLRHQQGRASFLEVLDAERESLDAQQQAVLVQFALLRNRVALYAALGG